MPKLPPWLDSFWSKRSIGSKVVCVAYGELGKECATPGSSNSRFAGEEMIDSEVIRLEMTSGEAGWTCTRFPSAARSFNDGGGSDPLRPSYLPSYLVRSGMGGGVEGGAILASWWCRVVRLASTVSLCSRCNLSWSVHCICSLQCRVFVRPCVSYQAKQGRRCEVGQKRVLNGRAHYALNFVRVTRRPQRATAAIVWITWSVLTSGKGLWDDKTRGEGPKVDNGETYAVNVSEMNRSWFPLSRATCHSASSRPN